MRPYARAFVHAGMVGLDGEKMSKSRGNLVFVSSLRRDGVDPMAIRLALLGHHYRDDWEWSPHDLEAAQQRLGTWRAAVGSAEAPDARDLVQDLREALANDLDAPQALRAVDRWAAQAGAGAGSDATAPTAVASAVDALLGVQLTT